MKTILLQRLLVTFIFLGLFQHCYSQPGDYTFIGQNVTLIESETGEIAGEGRLLVDTILEESDIVKITVRYAPDAIVFNNNGNPVNVERLVDFYFPRETILFEYEGEPITDLPLMVLLHAGSGDRNSIAEFAVDFAQRGYTVLAPSYRSNRYKNYCHGFRSTVYGGIQDTRAAVRLLNKIVDLATEYNDTEIEAIAGNEIAAAAAFVRVSRCDIESIFMTGRSNGGSVAFHTSSRIFQNQYESFQDGFEEFIITGAAGPIDIGSNGPLDAVGVPIIEDYPFPVQSLRGVISRTAAVTDSLDVNYENHPNPVPVCFIHGTCDAPLPYDTRTVIGSDGFCDPNVTLPDATEINLATILGSNRISKFLQFQNVYSELITFCGGGHASNICVTEIVENHQIDFLVRILKNEFSPGMLQEFVYRYDPVNYSTQCCLIGEEYSYLEKCDCDSEIGQNAVDISVVGSPEDCIFNDACSLLSYCDLTSPVGTNDLTVEGVSLTLVYSDKRFYLETPTIEGSSLITEVFDLQGNLLYTSTTQPQFPITRISLPPSLPKRQLLIGRVNGRKPIKIILD